MSYLLAINIGPVQDFIATARRSRDLWFGSWLLSELSKAAASYIHEHNGELIFPSREELSNALEINSPFSVVNKLVAKIRINDVSDVSPYCSQVYAAITDRLTKIKNDAFADLKDLTVNGKDVIRWHEADKQLNSLVEFYWAAVPFDQSNYEHSRIKVEALLAARKVTRNFDPVSWGPSLPKSSLDGSRESVIEQEVFKQLDDPKLTPQDRAKIEKVLRTLGVRGKEQLSGVDLLKRHGKPQTNGKGIDSFFSTSHVAATPLLNRLRDKNGGCHKERGEALEDFIRNLTKALEIASKGDFKEKLGHVHPQATLKAQTCFGGHELLYDGRILFAERFRELFPPNLSEPDKKRLKDAKKALRDFIALLNEKDLPRVTEPLPYYAILHGDGDRMGVVIDHEASSGPAQHQKLSRALSEFADDVKTIVEARHDGSCIYSGGDDVLALLPLHTALDCARELANHFAIVLKDFKDDKNNSPTLSVGLAIGHHLDPLQETLALAREGEKIAKNEVPNRKQPEKNALAITLSKRSGAKRTVKGSWDKSEQQGALDWRLHRFVFLLLQDELPDGVAYEFQDLALRLRATKDPTDPNRSILLEAQRAEAKRILRRKRPKQETISATVLDDFCGVKETNGTSARSGYVDLIDLDDWTLENLADELIVAREFARAIEQAGTMHEFARKHGFIREEGEAANDA